MKTTIDIADPLLEQTKKLVEEEHSTLRAVVEEGLRLILEKKRKRKTAFRLRPLPAVGGGWASDFKEADWERIRDEIYRGHGA